MSDGQRGRSPRPRQNASPPAIPVRPSKSAPFVARSIRERGGPRPPSDGPGTAVVVRGLRCRTEPSARGRTAQRAERPGAFFPAAAAILPYPASRTDQVPPGCPSSAELKGTERDRMEKGGTTNSTKTKRWWVTARTAYGVLSSSQRARDRP